MSSSLIDDIFSQYLNEVENFSFSGNENYRYQLILHHIHEIVSVRQKFVLKKSIEICAKMIITGTNNIAPNSANNRNKTKHQQIQVGVEQVRAGAEILKQQAGDLYTPQYFLFNLEFQNFMSSINEFIDNSFIDKHSNGQIERRILKFTYLTFFSFFGFEPNNQELKNLIYPLTGAKSDNWLRNSLPDEDRRNLKTKAETDKILSRLKEVNVTRKTTTSVTRESTSAIHSNMSDPEIIKLIKLSVKGLVDMDLKNSLIIAIDQVLLDYDINLEDS